mgnify:CR=1 FL=1
MSKKLLSLISGNHFSFFVKHFQGVTVYPVTAFGVGAIVPARADNPQVSPQAEPDPICSSAPRMMIEEIALVIAISGVCSEWATFQMTRKPTKQASTKTMKCDMKLAGATRPISSSCLSRWQRLPESSNGN